MASNSHTVAFCCDRIVTPEGIKSGAVLVSGETIVAVVSAGEIPDGCDREDFSGKVILPGLVDSHVHINEPGRTEWEGFETATRAAAAGGITTLVDMPLNSSPVTTTVDAFKQKLDAAAGKLYVDCGFHAGLVPGNAHDFGELLNSGVLGVKAFLVHSGIDEFPNATEADLVAAMPMIAATRLPLLVHAELDTGVMLGSTRVYAEYLASRPREMEQKAIEMMIKLCREFDCHTHIVHLASADAVPALRKARREGLPLTVETCPHYLFFNAEGIAEGDTRFKCAPPIRDNENRQQLWAALQEGVIDLVASDHSPCPPSMKQLETGDFQSAWGGISSLQFGLSIMWTEAKRRGHSLSHIAEWMCRRPAGLVGLDGKKGAIAAGHDADLVVFDPDASFTVTQDMIHHRHKVTPYEGKTLQGKVHATFLRGMKIYDEGTFAPPHGATLLRHQLQKVAVWNN
ncbi:MAG: allantoinase AllB [Bacteroidota bacterium]